MVALILTCVLQITVILLSCWFQFRHLKATKLRYKVLEMCSTYNCKCIFKTRTYNPDYNAIHWCYEFLPSSYKMAFSRKPITIEAYLKESEIKELTAYEKP